ncbi:MAG: biotin-dependent carboxyltransferase family protein [Pirellulaceae bacterium]
MNYSRVIQAGLMTTFQDGGRHGFSFYAIPPSGPLDRVAARTANALVGNALDATVLECTYTPPRILFLDNAIVGLAGADMDWHIDDLPVPRGQTLLVPAGSELWGNPAVAGCRSYLAIAGEIDTTRDLGSTACHVLAGLGGNVGRALRPGDQITWRPSGFDIHVELNLHVASTTDKLNVLKGPEFDYLLPESQNELTTGLFSITPESNRMGARLSGPQLKMRASLRDSLPVLPGMIQLPPAGNCIVVLQDGQTTGGYPRIAYLPQESLNRFCQLRIHEPFGFQFQ